MTTAPNLVESLLSTSEIETLCALNGVKARKAACMLANPRNLYAIQATERAGGNRVILLEAVAGRLRALGHPAEAPIAMTVLEPKAARKPREFKAKDDKEPIVTRMLAFERPAAPVFPELAGVGKALGKALLDHIEGEILNGPADMRPCPKCKRTETTGASFGYRKMKHTLKSGEVRIVTRRQSRCNKCRGGYGKAKPETAA